MIRLLLLAVLCACFSGCGFLDEDLLLDDEEFEESFSKGASISGHGRSGGSWGHRGRVRHVRVHRGRMSLGTPMVGNYGVSVIREYEFDSDDINGRLDRPSRPEENGVSDQERVSVKRFEDWHAEFIRAEEEWLNVDKAQIPADDKVSGN